MRLGTSVFLLIVGAIVAFGLTETTMGSFNLSIIGYIVMAGGLLLLVTSLLAGNRNKEVRSDVNGNRYTA